MHALKNRTGRGQTQHAYPFHPAADFVAIKPLTLNGVAYMPRDMDGDVPRTIDKSGLDARLLRKLYDQRRITPLGHITAEAAAKYDEAVESMESKAEAAMQSADSDGSGEIGAAAEAAASESSPPQEQPAAEEPAAEAAEEPGEGESDPETGAPPVDEDGAPLPMDAAPKGSKARHKGFGKWYVAYPDGTEVGPYTREQANSRIV